MSWFIFFLLFRVEAPSEYVRTCIWWLRAEVASHTCGEGKRTYCSFAVHCTHVLLTLTCLLLFFCCVLDELVSLYDVLEFLRNNWSFIIAICFTFFFYWNKIVLFSRNAFFEIKYVEIFSRCTFVVCRTCMFQNVKPHSHNEHGGSHVTCAQYQSVSGYRYLMIIRYNPGIQIL